MAILDVIGQLFGDPKSWSLTDADTSGPLPSGGGGPLQFKGQFVPQDMTENVGAVIPETEAVNKATPDLQWVSGESETFNFTARLFAASPVPDLGDLAAALISGREINVKKQVNMLKLFAKRDETLKRQRKFTFAAGAEIGFTCFIKSVQFKYDEFRYNGSLRGCVLQIVLQKIGDDQTTVAKIDELAIVKSAAGITAASIGIVKLAGVKLIPGLSLHTVVRTITAKAGDNHESIALRYYKSALLGDIIRRTHPEKPQIQANDKITIIDATEAKNIEVTPQSVALKENSAGLALREETFAAKNISTVVFI